MCTYNSSYIILLKTVYIPIAQKNARGLKSKLSTVNGSQVKVRVMYESSKLIILCGADHIMRACVYMIYQKL